MMSCFSRGGRRGSGGGMEGSGRAPFDVSPYQYSDRRQGGRSAPKVYGRDAERDAVVNLLVGHEPGEEDLGVISLVGIGGLGKTTLARCAYNQKKVVDHFDKRVWFLASVEFSLGGLVSEVIGSAAVDGGAALEEELKMAVYGKRILIVLDDVWDEGVEDLIRFRASLLGGAAAAGSKILLTTRSDRIVTALGSGGGAVYRLGGLSDESCWKLFAQRAFGAVMEETQELERIGKEIVEKCHGVPLVAIALGGMLHFERDRSVWANVRDRDFWQLPEMASHTLSALKLSYDRLPTHLKSCFKYCSLLPKAREIDREKLVELWTAEGLARHPAAAADESPEDVADGCFADLQRRSFFEEDHDDDDEDRGYKASYRMHDLFHDLARSVVGDENWTVAAGWRGRPPRGCRRLALVCGFMSPEILEASYQLKRLETLLFLMENPTVPSAPRCTVRKIPPTMFFGLGRLRLLDLSSTGITELPISVCDLPHLEHLNASETEIGELPRSLGNLRSLITLDLNLCTRLRALPPSIKNLLNLEVLNLAGCKVLVGLPEGLSGIRSLRRLKVSGCFSLDRMPPCLGRLSKLQTLSDFPVNEKRGCGIAELQRLDLRGKIRITNLGDLRDPAAAMLAGLGEKSRLRRLELVWNRSDRGYGCDSVEVLEALRPHQNLEVLEMTFYGGAELPRWLAECSLMPNLVEVALESFSNCRRLPPLAQLPWLKRLRLNSLDAVEQLGEDLYGATGTFPALEELTVIMMPGLKEWLPAADGRSLFPRLASAKIFLCFKLRRLPPLPSLRSLALMWNSERLLSEESLGGPALPCLKELFICRCAGPSATWDGLRHLAGVEELSVEALEGAALPEGLGQLSSLRSLSILGCPNLAAWPDSLESSTTLQSLEVDSCPQLPPPSEKLRRLLLPSSTLGSENGLDWRR